MAISPAVTVKAFDQFGNFASNDNSAQVTLAVANGPGGFTADSTLTATVGGGVATFSNLVLTAAGSYTLGESSGGGLPSPDLPPPPSTVGPGGGGRHLVFGIQPSGTTAGVAIGPAVTVKVFDQFGNFASNDNSDKGNASRGQRARRLRQRQHHDAVTVSGGHRHLQQSDFGPRRVATRWARALWRHYRPRLPPASPWSRRRQRTILAFGVPPSVTTAGVAIQPAGW